jgi:hypothetical protein
LRRYARNDGEGKYRILQINKQQGEKMKKTTHNPQKEECSYQSTVIEKGDTPASRGDLYDDIETNLDQISSLAKMAQAAYLREQDINPNLNLIASYCTIFLDMSDQIFLRLENLRKHDMGLEKKK